MFNRYFLLTSLAAVMLTACGGGTVSTPPSPAPGPQAHAWLIQAGASSGDEAYQGLQFYPNAVTVDVGDPVTWTFPAGEPHTVTLLGPRSLPPPPNDPSVQQPAGGATYDGSTYTSSGFLLAGKSYTLTFTKPGVYKVYCLIHGEMTQTITVQQAGAKYPATQTDLTAQATSAEQSDLQVATSSVTEFPYAAGGTHLAAGISHGLNTANPPPNSSVVRFVDGKSLSPTTTVPVGGTVTWTNLSSNLPHTVTFPVAGAAAPEMPPFSPPTGTTTYDGSQLANSGVMMPGQSFSLTFTKAGTYKYYCLFHDDLEKMIGTIVVQ